MHPDHRRQIAARNLHSALTAGITATFIYLFVAALVTGLTNNDVLMSFGIGIAVFVVAWIVTSLMGKRRPKY